ncbi:MAG: T9SS type A sorting domain-containing protein [Bacteroidetes bacterium]|nr:T9SS type A sorting domain-containing protein [Bacteroidota bacterium]
MTQTPCHNDGIVVASVTGLTPPITYYWSYSGGNASHTTNNLTDTLRNLPGYSSYSCYASGSNNLNILGSGSTNFPFSNTLTYSTPLCPATTGTYVASVSGGYAPYTIVWTNSVGSSVATGPNAILPLGNYFLSITDAHGCSTPNIDTISVVQISNISVSVTTTSANCTNGTASVTAISNGVAPYTYLWSNSQVTPQISNLTTGYYDIVVTDAQGCMGSAYAYIPQSLNVYPHVATTAATCTLSNGSAISFGSGGTPPYSYVYSNGQTTQSASGLIPGYYSVQVSDVNGCIGDTNFNIASSTPINVTYTATQSSCSSPTGSATLTVSGGLAPYSVTWATSPIQTGLILTGVPSGNYSFEVTDANQCKQTGIAYVPPISNLSVYTSEVNPLCPNNNGVASVNASSSYGPIAYHWNTGATTSSIGGLGAGTYSCVITDALGCQKNKSVTLEAVSSINTGFTSTPASCIYTSDGSVTAIPTGGTPPYSYNWYPLSSSAATISGVATGRYSVTVTDALGCTATSLFSLGYNTANNSCYCTVTGTVYYDANGNCIQDAGEPPLQHILVKNNNVVTAYPVSSYMFTDTSGIYSFILPTGSYNIQEVIQHLYPLSACQSNNNVLNITASSGCTYTVNFANNINPLHDVHIINSSINYLTPGGSYAQQVIIQNDGTVTENNIQLRYANDGQLLYLGASGINLSLVNPLLSLHWYNNTSTISLTPGASTAALINYNVPTNIPISTNVDFVDTTSYTSPVSNWLNDYTPWNNIGSYSGEVVESFDPNFKEVYPKGIGPLGYVNSNDTVFDYVIHFQNTGTANANKIIVMDTLDANFNWESLRPGYSNHNYIASMTNNGLVSFTFNNINLPYQNNSALGSIGTIAYSIHAKKGLPQGTQFKNRAAIFFDYNPPVLTNQTINTINNSASINQINSSSNGGEAMLLYPNPASDNCIVKISVEESINTQLNLYSIGGQLIQSVHLCLTKGENVVPFSVASLASGFYIARIVVKDKVFVSKLNITK